MKKKRKSIYLLLILTITLIGIGYAVIQKSIEGTLDATYSLRDFSVELTGADILDSSANITKSNISFNDNTLTLNCNFANPSDFVNLRIKVSNTGTYDAMFQSITTSDNVTDYIDYEVTYDDKSELMEFDSLKTGTNSYILLTVRLKELTKETIPEENINSEFDITLNYEYADRNVKYTGHDFVEFGYTGAEVTYSIPYTGNYKLEVWGAQGGTALSDNVLSETAIGGYGAYAVGEYPFNKDSEVYIRVGGKGANGKNGTLNSAGGFNGGGAGRWDNADDEASAGGGGATSIAKSSGALTTFSSKKDDLVLVAGGGGGGSWTSQGGHGGGFEGNDGVRASIGEASKGGTQSSGYAFGQGGRGADHTGAPGGGGGGGLWGGYGGHAQTTPTKINGVPGAGGSGWTQRTTFGTSASYCYQCKDNSDKTDRSSILTRTYSISEVNSLPIPKTAKLNSGYARMSYLG